MSHLQFGVFKEQVEKKFQEFSRPWTKKMQELGQTLFLY